MNHSLKVTIFVLSTHEKKSRYFPVDLKIKNWNVPKGKAVIMDWDFGGAELPLQHGNYIIVFII